MVALRRGCGTHGTPPHGPGGHPRNPERPDDHRAASGHARRADPRARGISLFDRQLGDAEAVRRDGGRGKPIARLREAHHVLRTFLSDGAIDFEGDYYSYAGLFTAARPIQDPFPIKMGAMRGPRSFELAGEIADGLHTAVAYSREALDFTAAAFRRGAERTGRDWRGLDLADNPLGAIAADPEPAREAARILAAFYIPSMPRELLARHGIDFSAVQPILDAFAEGDVRRALELTSPELGATLSVAGTPRDWIQKIEQDFLPAGFNHLLVTFADPFLVESWAGRTVDGLPSLEDQLRLFHDEVMPAVT
ncbi:MAG TPA: LLM class flavin-dependent oxidoreductase [Gaiellaceae bacterium]|nr:LLM class flavin-dependent oxidoreductase [Gaiellaceae bacterium]